MAFLLPGLALAEGGHMVSKGHLETLVPVRARPDQSGGNRTEGFAAFWRDVQDRVGPLQLDVLLTGYGESWSDTRIQGESAEGRATGGFDNRFKLTWTPWTDARFFLQAQYALADASQMPQTKGLLSNMNEQTSGGVPGSRFRVRDAIFTQHFLDRQVFVGVAVTDPENFMDGNRYANSQNTQFMSQLFVDEPLFDNVDEQGLMLVAGFSPHEIVEVTGLIVSTSRPGTSNDRKDIFDDPWSEGELIGGQIAVSPKIAGLEGNYRAFGWTTAYDQPKVGTSGEAQNWGFAFNFDQDVTEAIGLFGRLGIANPEVNDATWTWSLGAAWTGPIPGRDKDVLGFGVGGLQSNDKTGYDGMESHLETYYKFWATDFLALVPDFQYVHNPGGDPDGQGIVQGMLRLELHFSTP